MNENYSRYEVDGFPCRIVLHCLTTYGSKIEASVGVFLWSLDEISSLSALCQTGSGENEAREFHRGMDVKYSFTRMHANLEMLEGEVLYEK